MAIDAEIEPRRRLGRGNRRDVAVIDGFLEPALGGAVLQPRPPPPRDRLMRHIGIDIDPRHQSAAKTKTASHRVVLHLVLGCLRRVEGFDPVGAESGNGHGSSSVLHAQACTAAVPPQSFLSSLFRLSGVRTLDSHLPEYGLYAIR